MTFISADISAEFPDLRLLEHTLAARSGPSSPGLGERLRVHSGRLRGALAI